MKKPGVAFKKAVPPAIKRITVAGYKSINREQSIEIRPLTILAGANSSGKSSIMQPLLLMKQTLEAPYDPGTLLLDGPNIKFTSADQLFSRNARGKRGNNLSVAFEDGLGNSITTYFSKPSRENLAVTRVNYSEGLSEGHLRTGMTVSEVDKVVADYLTDYLSADDSLLRTIKVIVYHSAESLFSGSGALAGPLSERE